MDAWLSRTRPTMMVVALTFLLFLSVQASAWALPDYDGDGVVAPQDCAPLDGGVAPGKPDQPDLAFEDTNCDGIDGDESHAIFVSLSGDDNATGTLANPKKSINAGIQTAKAQGKDVYVAGGVYAGQVQLEDGVSVYGGYAPGTGQRSTSEVTTVRNTTGEAVIADDDQGVTLQFLTLEGNAAAAAGSTAYALRAVNGSSVSLDGVKAVGGAGRNGAGPSQPGQADPGVKGSDGVPGGYPGPFCGPFGPCPGVGGGGGSGGRAGGAGGDGGIGNAVGQDGKQGAGDFGGSFGGGGCITISHFCRANGGPGGDATQPGTVGGAGASAASSTSNAGATWTNGTTGSFAAAQGAGGGAGHGGGGGGGGRGRVDCNGVSVYGGGGGGGGGGGFGGNGGNGGGNGGGSFGVYLHNADVVIDGTQAIPGQLQTGNGGNGGTGAPGGKGGEPGPVSLGPAAVTVTGSGCPTSVIAGAGGAGGAGSAGGNGGPGGGGAGGPSAGIFGAGTAKFVLRKVNATIGNGGTGGARGGGGSLGGAGAKGTSLPAGSASATDTDFDGDGVKDVGDACPSIAALAGDADGCPNRPAKLADADGDQIPDTKDACVHVARGDTDLNEDGCPDPVDSDGDGFPTTTDCNDANPAINPGRPEIPENGVDENCDGFDGVNLDRDADGFPRPADCNDDNAAIHPGVADIPDNNVDENCDGSDAKTPPLPQNSALLSYFFKDPQQRFTKFTLFQVKNVPSGSSITVRCKKCAKRARKITKRNAKGTVTIKQLKGKIKAGAKIQVTVTKPGTIGVVKVLAIRSKKVPKLTTKCLQPGATTPSSCAR